MSLKLKNLMLPLKVKTPKELYKNKISPFVVHRLHITILFNDSVFVAIHTKTEKQTVAPVRVVTGAAKGFIHVVKSLC